jgi:hypothetical protein
VLFIIVLYFLDDKKGNEEYVIPLKRGHDSVDEGSEVLVEKDEGASLNNIFFDTSDGVSLEAVNKDKWAINTRKRLKNKGMDHWIDFLIARGYVEGVSPMTVFMEGVGITDPYKLRLLCLYAVSLKKAGKNPKDYFQALRGDFSDNFQEVKIFSDPRVMEARKVAYRWQARATSIKKEKNQKSPLTYEMLMDMFTACWPVGVAMWAPITVKKFDLAMSFAAAISLYNWGLRISEAAKTLSDATYMEEGPEWEDEIDQHAARAMDFMIATIPVDAISSNEKYWVWRSGYEWSNLRSTMGIGCGTVKAVGLAVRSSKSNGLGMREVKYMVTKGTPGEDILVDCITCIASWARYDTADDMFFSRVAVHKSKGRKRLMSKMVTDVLKGCAARLNLPVIKFSTKSLKTGGVSSLKALGVSQLEMCDKMDHSSARSSRHYQRPVLSEKQGPLAGGELGFSTASVRADLGIQSGLGPIT